MSDAPVQIRREEVVRDIRELAALKRKPITDAIADLVRAELARSRRINDIEARRREVEDIVNRLHELPTVGPILTDEDFYDEDGLPR